MSSNNPIEEYSSDFAERFIEVCGTSKPADISRLLEISYQAAKNYLNGRIPESGVLLAIAEKTPYSIHWLLTGNGTKHAVFGRAEDRPLAPDQFKALIRDECRKNVEELLSHPVSNAKKKVIVIKSEDIKDEKLVKNAEIFATEKK